MATREEKLALILKNLHRSSRILLFAHRDPDADAWGSTQAVRELLAFAGKKPHCIYMFKDKKPPKTMLDDAAITVYGPARSGSRTEIDLSQYEYALCLDTSYSDHNITGFKFKSAPAWGVGTIDHHSRSDTAFVPEQDYNLPDACATCEIVYRLVSQLLKLHKGKKSPRTLAELPVDLRTRVASRLLPGILDDIVGLTIPEKINTSNLDMLFDLRSVVGHQTFRKMLTRSRTLKLEGSILPYTKYLQNKPAKDLDGNRHHIYMLLLPEKFAEPLKNSYSSVITILEHYARTMCQRKNLRYGMFVMTIDHIDPKYSKFSARGPLIKEVFQGHHEHDHLFLSYGISGNSAMGGKVANEKMPTFPAAFMRSLQSTLKQKSIKTHEVLTPELSARLQALIDDPTD